MADSFGEWLKQRLIDEELAYPSWFKGCTAEEITAVMDAQGVKRLPQAFREYLEVMGHGGPNNLFLGEDWDYGSFMALKENAKTNAESFAINFRLPDDAFVFLGHQGHTHLYILTDNHDDDPPVYQYAETSEEAEQIADSLTAFFKREIHTHLVLRWGDQFKWSKLEALQERSQPASPTGISGIIQKIVKAFRAIVPF